MALAPGTQLGDVGPDYLVLEYLQGDTLGGPVAQDDAVRLASQIADALHAAHERGILHRDLAARMKLPALAT